VPGVGAEVNKGENTEGGEERKEQREEESRGQKTGDWGDGNDKGEDP